MDASQVRMRKVKAQTTANKKYISNMLNEIADHYQQNLWLKNGTKRRT